MSLAALFSVKFMSQIWAGNSVINFNLKLLINSGFCGRLLLGGNDMTTDDRIRIKINETEVVYAVRVVDASKSYDGFGTSTMVKCQERRLVII